MYIHACTNVCFCERQTTDWSRLFTFRTMIPSKHNQQQNIYTLPATLQHRTTITTETPTSSIQPTKPTTIHKHTHQAYNTQIQNIHIHTENPTEKEADNSIIKHTDTHKYTLERLLLISWNKRQSQIILQRKNKEIISSRAAYRAVADLKIGSSRNHKKSNKKTRKQAWNQEKNWKLNANKEANDPEKNLPKYLDTWTSS